mmetsp:Transcript_4843/g.12698  ORF Transcript_4843/g.12698 Transcript_4843/m.12698 type:complete len:260 (-) Transcript_4843:688-1467(-)
MACVHCHRHVHHHSAWFSAAASSGFDSSARLTPLRAASACGACACAEVFAFSRSTKCCLTSSLISFVIALNMSTDASDSFIRILTSGKTLNHLFSRRCTWARTILKGTGYCSTKSKYSRSKSQHSSPTSSSLPSMNSAGFSSKGSADNTPWHPVYAMQSKASPMCLTLPFASTGISSSSFTALIMSQSALISLHLFWSLVRPWTASSWHPASWIIRAYASVRSLSGNILILQKTGMLRFSAKMETSALTRGRSSMRKAP